MHEQPMQEYDEDQSEQLIDNYRRSAKMEDNEVQQIVDSIDTFEPSWNGVKQTTKYPGSKKPISKKKARTVPRTRFSARVVKSTRAGHKTGCS